MVANRDGLVQVIGWGKSEPVIVTKFNLVGGALTALSLGGAVGKQNESNGLLLY